MDRGAASYQRFIDGDNSGLVELVETYNDSIVFYINGFVNNVFVSEDIAADTFTELKWVTPTTQYAAPEFRSQEPGARMFFAYASSSLLTS